MLGSKVSLACETDIEMLTSYFQFSVKVLKSESQVSLLTLLRSANSLRQITKHIFEL